MMGALCLRMFPSAGVVALFEEPNTSGDVHDFDAPRNAPAKSPENHLAAVRFHSSFDNLEVAAEGSVTISHAATATTPGHMGAIHQWAAPFADHLLLDISGLGLSQPPFFLVVVDGKVLILGQPVQTASGGRARYVTAYATTTEIRLSEAASLTGSALAATSVGYEVIVFRDPPGDLNNVLFSFDPDTGETTMGLGRFSNLRKYLQLSVGASPYGLSLGRTIDLDKGAPRFVAPGASAYDPVPATARVTMFEGSGLFGDFIHYEGSFAGSDYIAVEAP